MTSRKGSMWLTLVAMTLANSMILVDQTAVPLATPDVVHHLSGAALMMPTALAIVSTVFPVQRRGSALGILAGASAFFAALGPVPGAC